MPFTPVHGLAALPFRRTRLDVPAIVIGSFTPDFSYFLHLHMEGFAGHTLAGIFVRDLPQGLIVLCLYRLCLEPILRRWYWPQQPVRDRGRWPAQLAMAIVCVLLGAATHILWDSFTHATFWPYFHFAFLREVLPFRRSMPVYKALQYASSILGSLAIVWLAWRGTRAQSDRPAPPGMPPRAVALMVTLAATAGGAALLYCFHELGVPGHRSTARFFLVRVVVLSMSFFFLELLAFHRLFYRMPIPTREAGL